MKHLLAGVIGGLLLAVCGLPAGADGVPCNCSQAGRPAGLISTLYDNGIVLRSIKYGVKPEDGPLRGNTSGLVVGDTILEAGKQKTTKLETLADAFSEARTKQQPLRLVVLDARTRQPFIHNLDLSGGKQIIYEAEVKPVNLTFSSYYLARPPG